MPGNGLRGGRVYDILSALLVFFQEDAPEKVDSGRAGTFFLGYDGSDYIAVFILLCLRKSERPHDCGICGGCFVVEEVLL